jgi:hypothetical protein
MVKNSPDEMHDQPGAISSEELRSGDTVLLLDKIELKPRQLRLLHGGVGSEFRGVRAGASGLVRPNQKVSLEDGCAAQNCREEREPPSVIGNLIVRFALRSNAGAFVLGLLVAVGWCSFFWWRYK